MTRGVSISELRTFRQCRRKWWLQYHRGLALRVEPPMGARALGTRIHSALETYYTPGGGGSPLHAMQRLEEQAAHDRALLSQAAEDPDEPVGYEVVKQLDDDLALARIMLAGYWEWLEESGADADLHVLESEQELRVGSPHPDYHLLGKLDARARRQRDGFQFFIDHKTAKDFRIEKTARLDEQFLMYDLLLRIATDEHVDGGVFNVLRKVKRTKTAKPPFYKRIEVRHNRVQLDSFWARLFGLLEEMSRAENELASGVAPVACVPPTPGHHCSWSCDFMPVCVMFDDGSRVEEAVENLYRERNPYDRYVVKGDDS